MVSGVLVISVVVVVYVVGAFMLIGNIILTYLPKKKKNSFHGFYHRSRSIGFWIRDW